MGDFQLEAVPLSSAVMVDDLRVWVATNPAARVVGERNGHRWCHLWVEPGNEATLHAFARKIGLKREWFQGSARFPHYDLTPGKREAALAAGAVITPLREWIEHQRKEGVHPCPTA